MSFVSPILILMAAFLVVFFEAWFQGFRLFLGTQIHFLPILIVYSSLTYGLGTITALAVVGGFLFDSLSETPLGVTTLSLFLIGWALHQFRGLLLRELPYAQFVLGTGACAVAPVLSLIGLMLLDEHPLLGWVSLWQWAIVALAGGLLTPIFFKALDRVDRALNYQPTSQPFRADRQIKRGRF
jgi:rod shape-determining protein MreD